MSDYSMIGGTGAGDNGGKKGLGKIRYDSPVTLTFAFLALAALGLGYVTNGWTTENLFSVYRSSISPLWFVRLFGHTLGHADMTHFVSNMTLFLLLGPQLERRYGSKNLLEMMGIASVVAAAFQMIFFPKVIRQTSQTVSTIIGMTLSSQLARVSLLHPLLPRFWPLVSV